MTEHAEATLLVQITELLDAMATMIAEQSKLLNLQATRMATLAADHSQTVEMANRANDTLRELVEIVDPSIWKDGQANMHDLIEQVRALKAAAS